MGWTTWRWLTNAFQAAFAGEREADPNDVRQPAPGEYLYTPEDRRRQLEALASALPPLIAVVQKIPELRGLEPHYRQAISACRELLRDGFNQEQLSELSRAVPDAFCRHKEWSPPTVQNSDGSWTEVEWFAELESSLEPVLKAARVLRYVGFY